MPTRLDPTPTMFVVAGPNGAGKTTFATTLLPAQTACREFLNSDLIAAGLAPFCPERQALRAGRLLLQRVEELVRERATFGLETTLAGRTYARLFGDARSLGYQIVVFYLWLPDVEMAVTRVANRVDCGGHNVPVVDIRRRYVVGLQNLFTLYQPVVDEWRLFDASGLIPREVATSIAGDVNVRDRVAYDRIMRQVNASDGR